MGGWWPLVERGSGGGGGGPLGDATIWPAVADWAGLASISNPRTGDRAGVLDLGTGNSTGVAQWSGSAWELVYGMLNSVADLLAFAEPIAVGALAGVEQSASDDETAVRYQWSGSAWERTPAGRPYVWTIDHILQADPTGIGLVRPGDHGVLPGSQVAAAKMFAAGDTPDGVARIVWLPLDVAAGATSLVAYGFGAESAVDLAAQGALITETGGGSSVGPVDGFTRIVAGGGAGNTAVLNAITSLGETEKVFMSSETRAGTTGTKGVQIADGTNGSRIYQVGAGAVQLYQSDGVTVQSTGVTLRSSGSAWPALDASPSRTEIRDDGRTVLTTIERDGVTYHTSKRNLVLAGFTRAAWVALVGATIDIRNFVVVRYA
jgi:hypothetical protein